MILNFTSSLYSIILLLGKSRSTAVIMAYLMQYVGLSFDDAFRAVKSTRPIAKLNDGFTRQLKEFEAALNQDVHSQGQQTSITNITNNTTSTTTAVSAVVSKTETNTSNTSTTTATTAVSAKTGAEPQISTKRVDNSTNANTNGRQHVAENSSKKTVFLVNSAKTTAVNNNDSSSSTAVADASVVTESAVAESKQSTASASTSVKVNVSCSSSKTDSGTAK